MKILYLISKYITFFSTVMKGIFEHITCSALNVLVEDGRYLQPNEMCGHIDHAFTASRTKTFFLGFIPGAINFLLALFLGGAGFMGLFVLKVAPSTTAFWIYAVEFYLGVGFFCNIFPLYEDALNNWSLIYQTKLTDEQKQYNDKLKSLMAYEKEAKKLAKANGDKSKKKPAHHALIKEASVVEKILFFIPSAIMLAGSFLEKYGLTFILSIVISVVAYFCI